MADSLENRCEQIIRQWQQYFLYTDVKRRETVSLAVLGLIPGTPEHNMLLVFAERYLGNDVKILMFCRLMKEKINYQYINLFSNIHNAPGISTRILKYISCFKKKKKITENIKISLLNILVM